MGKREGERKGGREGERRKGKCASIHNRSMIVVRWVGEGDVQGGRLCAAYDAATAFSYRYYSQYLITIVTARTHRHARTNSH